MAQKNEIGLAFRQARLQAGMTQVELADAAGIDRSYVSDVERGQKTPTLTWALYCAAAMNTTVSDIMQGVKAEVPNA